MVFFTCGQCGEALKKAQVEKHYQTRCRQNNVFSCIDCGKDFWGNDYENHTKCISEEEKYSGKNFVPKANANKGEVKQQQWIQQVQMAIDKVKANPQLRDLLERLKDYPNIPRKKAKFENFLKNSLRARSQGLISQVWDLIMAHAEKPSTVQNGATDVKTDKDSTKQDKESMENDPVTSQNSETSVNKNQSDDGQSVKKLNKRERTEERRKQNQKIEKKLRHINGKENNDENDTESQIDRKSKKKKKRKHEEEEESLGKKTKLDEEDQNSEVNSEENEENDGSALDQTIADGDEQLAPVKKKYKTKFDWAVVMQQVIKKKGEISVKKLRKKVLAEYLAQGCTGKSEEKLWAKFEKKLKKNPTFKVLKDRVKLVT